MTEWIEKVVEGKFYRRQNGLNILKILEEPTIVKNEKFQQEMLRLRTDRGLFDISFSSPLAVALKKAAEKLGGKIAGCVLKFEFNKETKRYGDITVEKDGEVLYQRSFEKIEEASKEVEKCAEILEEICEENSVYSLEALKRKMEAEGYDFSDDVIFHAMKKLEQEGKAQEVERNTWWFKRCKG